MVARRVPPPPPPWKSALTSVGVTGTNGKTSTTRFVAAALSALARPVASTTTVGSFLDDEPFAAEKNYAGFLAVLRAALDRGGRFAALEMTSEALARGFGQAWPCEVAVFTNLTHDHLDAHGSPEHYLASKAQLFVHLPPGGVAVLNAADANAPLLAEIVPPHARTLFYAAREGGELDAARVDVRARSVDVTWSGTTLELESEPALGIPERLTTAGIGAVFAENALAALVAAVAAGVPGAAAAEAIARASAPPGRFEIVCESPRVVVDYAHTPDALRRTLETARRLAARKVLVVFGAGGDRDKAKRAPMGQAASLADEVVLTSDNPRSEDPRAIAEAIRAGIATDVAPTIELDRRRAIELALSRTGEDDVLIVAGRGHETEQIVGAETRRFSDVEAIRELVARR
jgi:UDP-N-acetylmuramoyl-L-alanyl-D-glutamate--2,6-diaminopimelate ligase